MHKRYTFVLIPLLALICLDLSAMKIATIGQTPKDLSRPQFDVVGNARNIVVLAVQNKTQREGVLNGYFNCTDPYKLLALGAAKYQKNKFDKARIFWEHVLEQPQKDQTVIAYAWSYLGHAYYELNQPAKTQLAWKKAAKQEDEFFIKADALLNLSILFASQGKEVKALKKYDSLKKTLFNTQPRIDEPFHEAEALFYLSGVCEYGGEYEQAEQYYDMTLLLLERIGWLHTDVNTQVQAFKHLAQLATANGEEKIVLGYQKNINFLLNPPAVDDAQDESE